MRPTPVPDPGSLRVRRSGVVLRHLQPPIAPPYSVTGEKLKKVHET